MRIRIRLIVTAMLTVGALLAVASGAQASWTYSLKWGSSGSGNGQFGLGPNETEDPAGVAVDQSTGDVYAVDQGNLRVEKFDAAGNYLLSWGSSGPSGDAASWYGLAVDQSTHDVYVADQNYGLGYWVYSSSGTLQRHVGGTGGTGSGQFTYTTGIAVDSSTGDVYVTDGVRVQKFDSSGNQLTQWGSQGSGNGQLGQYPTGIAVDPSSHCVYVVDSANYRVEEFDSSGNYLGQWGSQGSGNGQFQDPNGGIAVDAVHGAVYVYDQGNGIQQFDASGSFIAKFGNSYTAGGWLAYNPTPTGTSYKALIYAGEAAGGVVSQWGYQPGSAAQVALKLAPASIPADGSSTSVATATVTDASGFGVSGETVSFSSSDAGEKISATTDNGDGTYTATITASTTVGSATITAHDGSLSSSQPLTQSSPPSPPPPPPAQPNYQVSVAATPPSLLAGSGQTSTVTATVTGNSQPVSGDQVTFGLAGSACGSVDPSVANTNSSGQAATKYTAGSAVGNCTIAVTDLTHSANQGLATIAQVASYQSPTAATCPTGNGIHCLSVTGTSATMTGEVSPHGCMTGWEFQVFIGSKQITTAPQPAGTTDIDGQPLNSSGDQYVKATVTGLTPGTTYAYRLFVTSYCADGQPRTADGGGYTFTTPAGCSQTVKFGPVAVSASCLRRVGLTWVASASENGSISLNGLQIVPTSRDAEVIFDPFNLRIEARGQVAVKFGPLYVGGQQVVGQVTLYQGSFDWVFSGAEDVTGLAQSLGEDIGLPTNPDLGSALALFFPYNIPQLGGTNLLDYSQISSKNLASFAEYFGKFGVDLGAPTVDLSGVVGSSLQLPTISVAQSMNLLGLPVSGRASLTLVPGGVQVKVHAGLGAPVNAGGDLAFTVGSDGSVSVDGFEIQVPQFDAGPLTIGDANGVNELSFDPSGGWCASHGGGADWHASTGVTIEPSDAALSGSIDFCNGVLRDVRASVDLPGGFPLFAPQAPVLYVNGGDLDLSFNPFSVNGGHLHMYVGLGGINAILGYVGVQSYQPGSLTVEITHASIVHLVPLPDFQATFYDSPPGLKLKLSIKHTWQTGWGPVSIDGHVGGELALEWPLHANLGASFKVDLPIGEGQISGVLSTKGIAACGNVGAFYAGVGYVWGHSGPDVLWTNCDLSPYSDKVFGAIDAAAGRHILVPSRLSEVALKVAGRGGAPRVAVHGPAGESVTSTAAGVLRSGRFAVIPDPSTDTTYVLIAKPHGGIWTVRAAPGSVPIGSVQASESLPPPSVSATVSGKGRHRRLVYRIRPIRGQQVEFSELAGRASHYLGTARGGRGVIAFVPLAGRGGPRAIQAQVFENGMPRARLVVAHYVAPATPLLGKPGHVRLSRRGGSLVVRWTAAFGARHYLVRVSMDGGQRFAYLVPARRRRVVVPGLFGRSRAAVTVAALDPLNHPGRAASASLGAKRGLPACTKRRKRHCIKPVKPLRQGHAIGLGVAWRSII